MSAPFQPDHHMDVLAGVMLNPVVPDWLIVVILTVVLLALSGRVISKALSMHAAETAAMQPHHEPAAPELPEPAAAKPPAVSPFAAAAQVRASCSKACSVMSHGGNSGRPGLFRLQQTSCKALAQGSSSCLCMISRSRQLPSGPKPG